MMLAVLPLTAGSKTREKAVPQEKLMSIVSEYSRKGDFEVTKVGRIGTAALKGLIRMTASSDMDKDTQDALSIISGIRSVAVVEYENSEEAVRVEFQKKVEAVLDSSDLLMEINDDGDNLKLYGVVSEGSGTVRDFVMYSPGDCTLVCLFGSIPLDRIATIANR